MIHPIELDQVCFIVCRISKMVHIVPCHKTIDAEHTAQLLLNHVFRLHGYPRTIVSDRDPRFISDIWNDCDTQSTADGQTERMNREIIRILTKASTEYGENWSDIIPLIEFAMNSSMGRGDVIFVVGEKVMVKRKFFQTNLSKDLISHKLESKSCGPFIITAVHGNKVTLDLVGCPKKHNVFNKDQIVKLYEDTEWLREEICRRNDLTQEEIERIKSRNQNTSSDGELDLSLQITTTRSGRKVTHKRLLLKIDRDKDIWIID
ncbi:hypothetical protein ACTFIY_002844 [Dictyostelium cf. discoideum]